VNYIFLCYKNLVRRKCNGENMLVLVALKK